MAEELNATQLNEVLDESVLAGDDDEDLGIPGDEEVAAKSKIDPMLVEDECGLPAWFLQRGSKMKVVRYVKQYEITHKQRRRMQITPKERQLYAMYRHRIGPLAAPMDYFVVARRLWKAGHPIQRPGPANIDALADD